MTLPLHKSFATHIALLLCLCLAGTLEAQEARVGSNDIVVLYENDAHGAIEGYPLLAALRDSMQRQTPHVAVVSCGDFSSGCAIGAISKGRYPVRMMSAVGYDYVVPGNHEFDFGVDTMRRRLEALNTTVLCGNFAPTGSGRPMVYPSSATRRFGARTVAFIGLTTPSTLTSSMPLHFQDSAGVWRYTFYAESLDSVLQACVDEVRGQGAEVVVLLAHIGDKDVPPLIAATRGVDVVLDGHFHSVIPHTMLRNADGEEVLWSSTGTKFSHIGMLVIPQKGAIWNTLLETSTMGAARNAVYDTTVAVRRAFDSVGARRVGRSLQPVTRDYDGGSRADSPMGNLVCDAYRALTAADIALCNSGGIRADLPAGALSYGDIFAVAPFENKICVVQMSGQALLDGLEMGCREFPRCDGEFPQVAGLTFEIDTTVASTVVCDRNGVFVRVDGARRVKNVRVWDAGNQAYVPLRADGSYRVAGSDYMLLYGGDGYRFAGAKTVLKDICNYTEALELYIVRHLNGTVDSRYANPQGRIQVGHRKATPDR